MDDGWNAMISYKGSIGTTLLHSLGMVDRPIWGPPPKEGACGGLLEMLRSRGNRIHVSLPSVKGLATVHRIEV